MEWEEVRPQDPAGVVAVAGDGSSANCLRVITPAIHG